MVQLLLLTLVPLCGAWDPRLPPAKPIYGVDFWRDAEGLSHSRIRAIKQTRDGYLWLGTDGGLVRFNGTQFTVFNTDKGNLGDNEVWALLEDADGALWIGTYGGGLTVLRNGKFKTFTVRDGLPDDVVMQLDMDRAGNIWMVTPQGLGRYSHGAFTTFATKDGAAELRPLVICARCLAGVLAGTRSGIYRLEGSRFVPFKPGSAKVPGNPTRILQAADGALWIGHSNGLIERIENGASKVYEPRTEGGRQITALYEDLRGGIWAAIGLRLTKFETGEFRPVDLENGSGGLGSIYSLCMDGEGSVWAGLQSNGLARLRIRQVTTLSLSDGLTDERTRSVFEDSRGTVWIGTADGISAYTAGRVSAWTEAGGLRLGDVRSVAETGGGEIWFSAGRELWTFRNGVPARVPGWNGGFEIEAVYRDPRGKMWIGTDGGGLYEFTGGGFRNFQKRDGLGSNQVRGILGDRLGALWISTFGNGVSRYFNGEFVTLTVKDGLAGDRVAAIHEDEEGALWFATRRGLTRLKEGKFFTFTSAQGMFTSFVYTIVDDGYGNFWFSSSDGIGRASKTGLRAVADGKANRVVSVSYGARDGLKTRAGNLGNQPAAFRIRSGQLLFSSMQGMVVVNPAKVAATAFVPPVHIEKVIFDKREQPLDQAADMPRGSGEVEFQFSALSYSAPEKLEFKYMLEGMDKNWVQAGNRRFTYYANLPPGEYKFRVIAGSPGGVWNEQGASFDFYLRPPFYRTRVFYGLCLAAAGLLVWLAYRIRMLELRARYAAVLAERNRISGDLHDTLAQNLAGIALQLDSVHMHLPDVEDSLRERLEQACNLTRYSLAEARRSIADLRQDELECPPLETTVPALAEKAAKLAELVARVQVLGSPRKLSPAIERNLLRIFQEALANAVKHSHARNLDVQLSYGSHSVTLRILDDGMGFDADKTGLLEDGHYGLIGIRERAERIGAQLTLNTGPGRGTNIFLEVPL